MTRPSDADGRADLANRLCLGPGLATQRNPILHLRVLRIRRPGAWPKDNLLAVLDGTDFNRLLSRYWLIPYKTKKGLAVAAKNDKNVGSTLTISGLQVAVTHERVSIDEIRLDPNNPRIRLQIRYGTMKKPATPEDLLSLVRAQPGYDDLQKQIRKLGGIYDPIIVRHNGTVVEGNTRLAALRVLHGTNRNDDRWKTAPITRLPADIPENVVEMLMANFHIAGKTMWRAAAQADQIYRLVKELKVPIQQVADETRKTTREVEHYLAAYEYLIDEVLPEAVNNGNADWQQVLETKFSHALELIKGKKLQAIRNDPEARKVVTKLIAHNKITGAEVRKLPDIISDKKTTAILKKDGFKAASDARKKANPTVGSPLIKSMQKTTELLQSMPHTDIALFTQHASAKEALENLALAVENLVSLSAPAKGKRGA